MATCSRPGWFRTCRSAEHVAAAHAKWTICRLRPKLMTVVTMAAGLLPLLWADGAGAEIMKRVAVPMLGGLATSAFLTLEALPVMYTIWRTRQLRSAQRAGVPIARWLDRRRGGPKRQGPDERRRPAAAAEEGASVA